MKIRTFFAIALPVFVFIGFGRQAEAAGLLPLGVGTTLVLTLIITLITRLGPDLTAKLPLLSLLLGPLTIIVALIMGPLIKMLLG